MFNFLQSGRHSVHVAHLQHDQVDERRKHNFVHAQDTRGRQRAAPHPPPPQDPVRHRVSEVEAVPGAGGARRHRLQEGHGPEEVGRGNLKGIFLGK